MNAVNELFDNFKVDVGFQQRQTNLLQRLGDVLFSEDSLSAKRLKGALEFFLEIFEHRLISLFYQWEPYEIAPTDHNEFSRFSAF